MIDKMSALARRFDAGLSASVLAAVRVLLGLLWLQNCGWKIPPRFEAVRGFVQSGIDYPVFPPFSTLLDELVAPNFELFGWVTLVSEVGLAVFLLSGLATRLAALVGAGQALFIGLTVANTPNEWGWAYWLLVAAHLAVAASPQAGRTAGLDGRSRGEGAAGRRLAVVAGGLIAALGVRAVLVAGNGPRLGPARSDDLPYGDLVSLDRSGGLIFAALGVAGMLAVLLRRRGVTRAVALCSTVAALVAGVVVVDQGSLFGFARPGSIAVLLVLGVILALAPVRRAAAGPRAGADAASMGAEDRLPAGFGSGAPSGPQTASTDADPSAPEQLSALDAPSTVVSREP